ncbi:AzlD domain-containing protein [Bacillus sp. V3B]|uniref:AzlD domain-containing protein n=1 Tax=Bacillus sp. V3B TaxID=2804915 RepID=UPI00210BC32F|nr:AzlD domain-containing protein [Bacillus sp. V3B]MCQ6276139.1 AzlD domain-containing protein [Bacillus sp. V3B]
MEVKWTILLIIIGCTPVIFIPRVLPLMVLSQMELPKWAIHWLKNISVAVMDALLAQELLLSDNQFSLSAHFFKLLAAIPAFVIAILTKSLLGTVMVGVISMMIFRFMF